MALVPLHLLPEGVSQHDVFVGINWTFSKNMGVTVVERSGDRFSLQIPGAGQCTLEPEEGNSQSIRVTFRAPQKEDLVFVGRVTSIAGGIEVCSPDGRAVKVTRQGDHLALGLRGFGAKDAAGIFLRQR